MAGYFTDKELERLYASKLSSRNIRVPLTLFTPYEPRRVARLNKFTKAEILKQKRK